jgi:hypothetical protein
VKLTRARSGRRRRRRRRKGGEGGINYSIQTPLHLSLRKYKGRKEEEPI